MATCQVNTHRTSGRACRRDASGVENITKNINAYEQATNSAFAGEGGGWFVAVKLRGTRANADTHAHRGRLRTTTFLN